MERGLALTLFILISLGIAAIKILEKAGSLHERVEWHRYVASYAAWLILVPLLYAAICELARGVGAPTVVLTVARALGFLLLAGFALIFVCIIYDL